MKANIIAWAAIRRSVDDHHEFIDLSSIRGVLETTIKATRQDDHNIPNWTHANPVRRIVQVTITEE